MHFSADTKKSIATKANQIIGRIVSLGLAKKIIRVNQVLMRRFMERLEAMKNSIESFTFSLTSIFQTTSRKESTNGIQVMTRIPGALRTSIWDAEMTDADLDSIILTQINVAETILQIVRLLAGTNIEDITVTSSAGVL